MSPGLNSSNASHCYIDFDLDQHRSKLARAAAFVHATDSRYGFSSKDLRLLGGSEVARIKDLIASDHEWAGREVEVRPPEAGSRVVVRLFWDVAPLACENFCTLCANGSILRGSNEKKAKPAPIGESGKPLTYRGSTVHRVVPEFIIQGGDFVFGNGSGGESIFNGKKFKDERAGLSLKHDRRGILSMGNSGKNSNTSQWFITLQSAPQCDGKHVIFGEVVSGWSVLDGMEQLGNSNTGGEPDRSIIITDCGLWTPLRTPGAGYYYDQPDTESYSGVSPVFLVRPRVAVLAPAGPLEKFDKVLRNCCAVTKISTADLGDSIEAQASRIEDLLDRFEVDIAIVAPTCKKVADCVKLPESWLSAESGFSPSRDQVLLTVKPADALEAIRSTCWLSKHSSWQLDGMAR